MRAGRPPQGRRSPPPGPPRASARPAGRAPGAPTERPGDAGGELRRKRSLTHVGGEVRVEGDAEAGRILGAALDVASSVASAESEEAARAHVHGFHSYPARMHPGTARGLVLGLSEEGGVVLDPFCGSGTVLVEARVLGRRALGVDANPLAVRLASLKASPPNAEATARVVEAAAEARALADERRRAKTGSSRRYGRADLELFDPHVLFELDGLRLGIEAAPPEARGALWLVLSSILTKVSRKSSDTSEARAARRIAAGYPARLFAMKAEELGRRLDEARALFGSSPPARVLEGDARALEGVASGSVDLVVTSPPYPGVYDYLAHHAARLRWLGLPQASFDAREIGARRRLDPLGPGPALSAWRQEAAAFLAAMARVLHPGGRAALLIADSVVAGAPAYALPTVREAARRAGLDFVASASQARPHFHAPSARAFSRRPREEHAILLRKP